MSGLFRVLIAFAGLLLFSAGPAAAQIRNLDFGPGSPKALLVLASPSFPIVTNTSFRRVDMASGTFLRGDQTFRSGVGPNGAGGVHLSVREVEPGDYALVRLLAIQPGPTVWTCMPEGAPVFTLRPGEIAVIRTDQWWWDFQAPRLPDPGDATDDAILRQIRDLKASNPRLLGEARLIQPTAVIQWRNPGASTRDCVRSRSFERLS